MRVKISNKELTYIYEHICYLQSEISEIISEIDEDKSAFPNPIFYEKIKSIEKELYEMEAIDFTIDDISEIDKLNNVYRSIIGYPEKWTIPRNFKIFEFKK